MYRILGLDVGDRKIGVAVSDSSRTIARGIDQVRWDESQKDKGLEKIKELISQYEVGKVVVGLPKNMKGEEGFQAKKVRSFLDFLSSKIKIPAVLFDERFSTVMAEKILREEGASLSERKKAKDKIAAAIILQSYLDSQRIRK